MKPSLKLLALLALLSTGCDKEAPSREGASRQITVEDLAWATDWKIYKWKLSDLTDEKLREIQLVVIGPGGEVTQEGASVGYNSVLDSDMEIALAIKRDGADVLTRLRGQMGTVSSTMEGVFTGNSWACGPDGGVHDGLLVVASDSNTTMVNSQSQLAGPGNKLCLKLWPFDQQEAGARPAITTGESRTEGEDKPDQDTEGR